MIPVTVLLIAALLLLDVWALRFAPGGD